MSIALRPCPCCDGPARFYGSADGREVFASCHECGVRTMEHAAEAAAAEVWNRRTELKPWPCWNHKEPTKDCEFCYQAFTKLFEPSKPQHVYTRGGKAVVTGVPGIDHNCDNMGCPSVEHVLYRLPHSDDEQRNLFAIKAGCILGDKSIQTIIDSPNFRGYEKAMAREIQLHRRAAHNHGDKSP